MDEKDNVPFFEAVTPTEFRWPVKVPVPENGGYKFAKFTGVFKYLDEDAFKAWLKAPEGKAYRTNREMADDVLIGVEDLVGSDGQVVASSPELVAKLLAVRRAPQAVVETYVDAMNGTAAEKNS